ncbi:hypothetical protein JJJ17_09260 [Paracoccus caeni]|uniref:Uncharacterized protein n=1 Tax=Paracoccus caeni TaxID=657651 RepID=A0A934SIT1_9RHOB|nr:hypothetical protein [Paracoccus caeni]MBK4216112.1 hypothetical protein [Paracoccus caeni]
MTPLICTPNYPCWIPGTGFRPVMDTASACAIDDTPMTGKMPPVFYGTDHVDPLELLRFIFPGDGQLINETPAAVQLMPVSVPESLVAMCAALAVLLLFKLLPEATADAERLRGKDKSGWC